MTKIKLASQEDVSTIVSFMSDMQDELQEFALDRHVATQTIACAIDEGVYWFLFLNENNEPFGACYLQSVHNYWREKKRFYLGGFYIAPMQRGKGLFKDINKLLKDWVSQNGGVQIYAHIHKDNEKSLQSFHSVGLVPDEYLLCVNHWGEE
ncbi:MAG: GNAT family N-acetyltransferase [Bdellovibrionales bacterium]